MTGLSIKFYSSDRYTLLPAHYTWGAIWDEMHKFVESSLMVLEPTRATMRKVLTLHCPTIRIRSPRTNVCDFCAIYHAGVRGGATTGKTEALGRHAESARQMRREYKRDKSARSSKRVVIVMDYSQYLTIPSVVNTPSQWYFCSLLSSNLVPSGSTNLTVYADNCSGQNKNNYVIKFLLTLVDMGIFEHVELKFFRKGHTKNSCDRGFGHIRKHMDPAECWTMDHVIDAVNAAASSSDATGACMKGPESDVEEHDLRRKIEGVLTAKEKVVRTRTDHIEVPPPAPVNTAKNEQMYKSIRPKRQVRQNGDLPGRDKGQQHTPKATTRPDPSFRAAPPDPRVSPRRSYFNTWTLQKLPEEQDLALPTGTQGEEFSTDHGSSEYPSVSRCPGAVGKLDQAISQILMIPLHHNILQSLNLNELEVLPGVTADTHL
ncbi:hypothetical protein ON010_g10954 [Phytophthora cinnamomi]|nr:hypothetical protein ON010_g10954 [Phytophthora cinnamomi]